VSGPAGRRKFIGQPIRRDEDRRLVVGAGQFVDDLRVGGCLVAAFLRSPWAHARIEKLDVADARSAPGVVEVLTGADVSHLRCPPVSTTLFPEMKVPDRPVLAREKVTAVGAPVAVVLAEDAYRAQDALERIHVRYEPMDAVSDVRRAVQPDAPVIFPELGTNVAFARRIRHGDVEEAFAAAAHVARVDVTQPLLAAVPLEPRGIVATFDVGSSQLTLWVPSQAPFLMRTEIAVVLGIPESRVRVISQDVGGAFGLKASLSVEQIVAAFAAMRLARPVKWMATRSEDLMTTPHGRGCVSWGELAIDNEGRISGLRARILYPLGTDLVPSVGTPAWNHLRSLPGPYVIPTCALEVAGLLTTTAPTAAYRGAGRPEGTFLIERLMDAGARAAGRDPAEFRRRNLIAPNQFPYRTVTGQTYDSGAYARALDKVLKVGNYTALRKAQERAAADGRIVGIGVCVYVEAGSAGWESGTVRVERTGSVTAISGACASGQGHETTFRQIVADYLGVELGDVSVRQGDTLFGAPGIGTFGSRSTAVGGSALAKAAAKVERKARRIAARLLEASPRDIVRCGSGFQVKGVPEARRSWAEIADAAYRGVVPRGDTPGLEVSEFFSPKGEAWSFGAVLAMVGVDRDTGHVHIERLVWVDDAGTIVNPLLAAGQLHGGLAQGYGQALLEEMVYDPQGQLLTGSLMDYAMPRADGVPVPEFGKMATPSPHNPLRAKGVGEAGCIGIPPAVVGAVLDALHRFGISSVDMPLTNTKIGQLLLRIKGMTRG
jgi:carbon-monoxide dehydrogenase large subunit